MDSSRCPNCHKLGKYSCLKTYQCGNSSISMCSSFDCTYPLEMNQSYWLKEKELTTVNFSPQIDANHDSASVYKQSDSSESIIGELLDLNNPGNDTESCDLDFIDELLGPLTESKKDCPNIELPNRNISQKKPTITRKTNSVVSSDVNTQHMNLHHRSASFPLVFWKPNVQRNIWLKLLQAILLHCTAFQIPQDSVGNIKHDRCKSSFIYRLAILQFNYAICLKELQHLSARSSVTEQSATATMEDLTNFAKESWTYFESYFDFIDKFSQSRSQFSVADALIAILDCKESILSEDKDYNEPKDAFSFREKFELSFVNDISCNQSKECGLSVQRSSSYLHVAYPLSKSFALSQRSSLSTSTKCPKCKPTGDNEPLRTSNISWWKLSSCLIVRFTGKPRFRVFNIDQELSLPEEDLIPTVILDSDNTLWLRHCENLNYWLKLSLASPNIVYYSHDEMFTQGFSGLEMVILERQCNRSFDIYPNPDFHQLAAKRADSSVNATSESASSSGGSNSTASNNHNQLKSSSASRKPARKRKRNTLTKNVKQMNLDSAITTPSKPSQSPERSVTQQSSHTMTTMSQRTSVMMINNNYPGYPPSASASISGALSDRRASASHIHSASSYTGRLDEESDLTRSSSALSFPHRASSDADLPGSSSNYLLTRYLANQVHRGDNSSTASTQRRSPSVSPGRGRSSRKLPNQVRISRSPSPNFPPKQIYHPCINEQDALRRLINSKVRTIKPSFR